MAPVTFKATSDFEKVKKDYDQLAQKTAKVESENRRLKDQVSRVEAAQKRQQQQQGTLLRDGLRGLENMVAGWGSVTAAIQLATRAYQEHQQIRREALDANLTVAKADAQVVRNLVGETTEIKRETLATLGEIATRVGIESEASVKFGFSAAISKASGDRELALRATEAAARLNIQTPEAIGVTAGGAVQISRLAGGISPEAALGFLADVQGRSPIVDPRAMLAAFPAAIAGVTGSVGGGTAESVRDAGALFAALGTAGGDETGASTGTAAISLATQLETFFRESGALDPGTITGRIQALQRDEALRAQLFQKGLAAEKRFLIPFRELLSGEGLVSREFEANLTALSIEGGEARFEKQARELRTLTDSLRLSGDVSRDIRRSEEGRVQDVQAAQAARVADLTREAIRRSQQGMLDYPERFFSAREFDIRQEAQDPIAAAIATLQRREMAIRQGHVRRGLQRAATAGLPLLAPELFQGGLMRPRGDEELSPTQLRAVQLLQEVVAELQGMQAAAGSNHAAALAEQNAQQAE